MSPLPAKQQQLDDNAPIRRISKKRKGCWKPPLRIVLGVYIISNALIVTAVVLLINIAIYQTTIFDLGASYQRLLNIKTKDDIEEFFRYPVQMSNAIAASLVSTEGFMVPSDNRELNTSHPMTKPFDTAFLASPLPVIALSLFFDDGSQYLSGFQNVPTTLVSPDRLGQTDSDIVLVKTLVSKDFAVTEEAFFARNRSSVPLSSPIVESFGLTLASAVRPPFYSGTKALAYLFPAFPDFSFYWGGAIGLKVTASRPAYVALSATQPMINSTFHYIGVLGIAVDTSLLDGFLRSVLRESGTTGMQSMIIGSGLEIYATSLTLPYSEEVTIPAGDAVPIGCLRTSESISSTVTNDLVLCVKTAMNIGFTPSRRWFERYSYVIRTNDITTLQEYYSGIFDIVDRGGFVTNNNLVKDDNGKEYLGSFARLDNPIVNFVIGAAYFTPVDDFFKVLNSGQTAIIGTAVGAIVFAIIVVEYMARVTLKPLEDVAQLMVATAQLRFDAESKFISKKGYLAHGKNDQVNKKRTQSFVRRGSMRSLDRGSDKHNNSRSGDVGEMNDENNSDDEKEIERKQKQEVEDSLSSIAEIRALQKAQMNMSNALNSFTKYLSRSIVQELQVTGISLGMSKKRATVVLQSDISGFTTLSESVPPNVLSDLLTIYFEKINGIVISHGLVILMFVGDAVFAVSSSIFGGYGNDELKAALCALEMQRTASIHPLTEAWDRLANKRLWQRIGINCGEIFAGITGSTSRLTYTVSGPNADFAQYLEAAGKTFGTLTTVSSTIANKVKHVFALRLLIPLQIAKNYSKENQDLKNESSPKNNNNNNDNNNDNGTESTSSKRYDRLKHNEDEQLIVEAVSPVTSRQNSEQAFVPADLNNNNNNNNNNNTKSNNAQKYVSADLDDGDDTNATNNKTSAPSSPTKSGDNHHHHQQQEDDFLSNKDYNEQAAAASCLASGEGTIMNAYELVGLLPNINVEETIKPDRAFVHTSGMISSGNPSGGFMSQQTDSEMMERFKSAGSIGTAETVETPTLLVKRGDTFNTNSLAGGDSSVESGFKPQSNPTSPLSDHQQAAAFAVASHVAPAPDAAVDEMKQDLKKPKTAVVDIVDVASSRGSEASNESFLARVAANPLFYLPTENLFNRGYAHTKCTYVATELEIRFSREWTQIVRHFANGDPALCLSCLEDLKKKTEYGIFFADSTKEFGCEEAYEKMYRECVRDPNRCAATFIRARKSEKVLIQTCKDSLLAQQERGNENVCYAMKM